MARRATKTAYAQATQTQRRRDVALLVLGAVLLIVIGVLVSFAN